MLVFYPLCVLMTVCISLCVSYCARTSVLCKWSYGPYCPVVFLLNFIHSFFHLFIKQACPKGIYRPSERRVETYTGRVGAELINQNYINIRKKTRRTDERTVTGALIFAHCYLLRTRPSQLLAPCVWICIGQGQGRSLDLHLDTESDLISDPDQNSDPDSWRFLGSSRASRFFRWPSKCVWLVVCFCFSYVLRVSRVGFGLQ